MEDTALKIDSYVIWRKFDNPYKMCQQVLIGPGICRSGALPYYWLRSTRGNAVACTIPHRGSKPAKIMCSSKQMLLHISSSRNQNDCSIPNMCAVEFIPYSRYLGSTLLSTAYLPCCLFYFYPHCYCCCCCCQLLRTPEPINADSLWVLM
jgi:hypothetical protein